MHGSSDDFESWLEAAAGLASRRPQPRRPLRVGDRVLAGRYVVDGELGRGGMGVVYAVTDELLQRRAALKTLTAVDARGIYRLKREFRSLAQIAHPSLVAMYELHVDAGLWFFTMEHIYGQPWNEQVTLASPEALQRLFGRLAVGVHAIHLAGQVHRDLKPSNVLVRAWDSTPVILDFGLATAFADTENEAGYAQRRVSGTPGYMAPEQARGEPASAASDWYAFGVMLREAVALRDPFGQAHGQAPGFARLRALSAALLRDAPSERPPGEQVLALLDTRPEPPLSSATRMEGAFLGRARELSALEQAFERTRQGSPTVVWIRGSSGIGKTTLLHRLASELRVSRRALVLQSRCYEREAVPFKALDGALDELSRQPVAKQRALPPPAGWSELIRVFPATEQAHAEVSSALSTESTADPQWLRRRASNALRAWLRRITEATPLVMCIDDLHWGDADSAGLLTDLLRGEGAPGLLLVGSYRAEYESASPFFAALRELEGLPPNVLTLSLPPFSEREAIELARLHAPEIEFERARAIAARAAGNPFLTSELSQHALCGAEPPALEALVEDRLARLPAPIRPILQAVVVAGHPVDAALLEHLPVLAAPDSTSLHSALQTLCAARLLRQRPGPQRATFEPYHDLIAKAVGAGISHRDACAYHLAFADRLARAADPDAALIIEHCVAAGEPRHAAVHARAAAERARAATAFEQAATLYRLSLSLTPVSDERQLRLQVALAEVLEAASRGREAARAFLDAAELVRGGAVLERVASGSLHRALRRRAAELLLTTGDMDAGRELVRELCAEVGVRLPKTAKGGLVSARVRRAWLRVRGLDFRARTLAPDASDRLELLASLCVSFGLTDFSTGAELAAQYLTRSLSSGDRYHVAYALAIESAFEAREGLAHRDRARTLFERAVVTVLQAEVSREISAFPTPPPLPLAIAHVSQGDFQAGRDAALATLAMIPAPRTLPIEETRVNMFSGVKVSWTTATARAFLTFARYCLGEFRQLSLELPDALSEAAQRSDSYATCMLASGFGVAGWLAQGRPEQAARWLEIAGQNWQTKHHYLQDFLLAFGRWSVAAYEGQAANAFDQLRADWPALVRSQWFRAPLTAMLAFYFRGSFALAAAERGRAHGLCGARTRGLVREASACAARIEKLSLHGARGMATLLRASVAHHAERDAAPPLLHRAEVALSKSEMRAFAAAAQRARGLLLGGEQGQALREQAARTFAAEGVVDVEAFTRALAPGL